MKKILTALFCLLLVQPAYASGTYKKIDFTNVASETNASKILYEYVLKKQNMTPAELAEFARITPESVVALEVDLNDDGTNEIIGFIYSTFYWGTAGYNLFILHKQPNGYNDISFVNFEPQEDFYIFNTKTNGYRDIKFYGSFGFNFRPFIAKYINGYYQNDYQTKSLERALRQ